VHNGIVTDRFSAAPPAGLRAELAQGSRHRIVLTVARLDPQKGHNMLIAAASAVPDAVFVCAGAGSQRAALEAEARARGVAGRLRFLGHREDIPALLAASDVVVLPSLYEGLPLAVLEGMAAGKPVVATAIGGTDEAVVDGETGLLVPGSDPAALAAAIRRVLDNPAFARTLGEAGRARVITHFSSATMVARVEDVYDELVA
jgi:glycosyltransferase involved in cell wall biosynthesis